MIPQFPENRKHSRLNIQHRKNQPKPNKTKEKKIKIKKMIKKKIMKKKTIMSSWWSYSCQSSEVSLLSRRQRQGRRIFTRDRTGDTMHGSKTPTAGFKTL